MRPRKRIRLDPERYADPGSVWHATAVTLGRHPVFADATMAKAAVDSLHFVCTKGHADLLLYCVMPDHIHAVVAIVETDLISIMRDFKSWTTHMWTQRTGDRHLWQLSFLDHGVRRSENADDLVAYVLKNPVDAGLASDWSAYPWLGGSLIADAPT